MSDDIIKSAQEKFKRDKSHWSDIYDRAIEDLHFLSDDEFAQWDRADYEARVNTGRPALTIDQLGQFIHQVANDIRINTPTINVIPGRDAAVKTAEVYKGLIRNIEYSSSADDAYDYASLNSIKCGIGFIKIDHDYVDDESSDQELKVLRVINPLAWFLDSESVEVDGRDAKHAIGLDRVLVSDFKRMYPGKNPVSFDGAAGKEPKDDEHILIAEYFVIEETEKELENGRIAKSRRVLRYKISGEDVLEETTFPGKYIPIVPVYGEEHWVEGKRNIYSLIRKSKSAQRMFNYWKSLETELLMKQPQAPIMAAEGQIEDYAEDWKNPSKAMALRYKTTDAAGNPVGAPQRLEPPTIPIGIVNAARATVDDIKATMGIYNASLGQRSNEQSGVAIAQRKQEGDVATFHFQDNLTKSIAQVGRILVCAIPEIYDTPRVLRIIGMEEEPEEIGVNGMMTEDQDETVDLTRGKYDVKVISGAGYTTRRQEAAEFFTQIVTRQPDLMAVMGDLLFKNMDFSGAQAMAERMKKVIDPKFLSAEDRQDLEQEQGVQPAQDPEKMQMAQVIQEGAAELQTLQQKIAQLESQLKDKQADYILKAQSNESDVQVERAKIEIQAAELRLSEQKIAIEAEIKAKELALKERELSIKERESSLIGSSVGMPNTENLL